MIPMVGGSLLLFESFLNLFRTPKSHRELVPMVLGDLAVRSVESPYGIALDINEDLSAVEEAVLRLENQGIIQRSSRQIVVPDDGEEIPRVYVRYEFVGSPS